MEFLSPYSKWFLNTIRCKNPYTIILLKKYFLREFQKKQAAEYTLGRTKTAVLGLDID